MSRRIKVRGDLVLAQSLETVFEKANGPQNWLSTNRTIILNIGDFSPNTTIAQFSKLDNSSEYSTQSGHMQLAPVSTKNHKSL